MPEPDVSHELPTDVFTSRRARAFDALGSGVLILPAAPILYRSRDTEVRYRPDSELYYLTGATEPETVAVLVGAEKRFVLFVRDHDADAELWTGRRLGPEGAAERFGADETLTLDEIDSKLPNLLQSGDRVHFRLGGGGRLERLVLGALKTARSRGARQGTGPRGILDPGEILDEMRLVKDAHEIERMRAAAHLTVEGHRAGLAATRPGTGEWVVEAAVEATFRRGGAAGPGFETIVGSGPNACVLHYVTNDRTIGPNDLVLIDAGADLALYNGDVTRTAPASGRFTDAQRSVYDLVEAAREQTLGVVRPGTTVEEVHTVAAGVLSEGLVELGLLDGPVDKAVEQGDYRAFFPHRTSHWLGLDVHEPGDFAKHGVPRELVAGMVITIEPGLYIPPGSDGAAAPYAGIGVRIEDEILVTSEGHENLSGSLPTAADEVEMLVGDRP